MPMQDPKPTPDEDLDAMPPEAGEEEEHDTQGALNPEDRPVFDRAEEDLPLAHEDSLPTDDENNILPGNDPMDDDPVDNGAREGNDPDDRRRRMLLGDPMPD